MEHIYLLQPREFLKTNVYKLGKTKQDGLKRAAQYPKGSLLILHKSCENCDVAEKQLLDIFRNEFVSRIDIGSEYFVGDKSEMVITIENFLNGIQKSENDLEIKNDLETEKEAKSRNQKTKRNMNKGKIISNNEESSYQNGYQDGYEKGKNFSTEKASLDFLTNWSEIGHTKGSEYGKENKGKDDKYTTDFKNGFLDGYYDNLPKRGLFTYRPTNDQIMSLRLGFDSGYNKELRK